MRLPRRSWVEFCFVGRDYISTRSDRLQGSIIAFLYCIINNYSIMVISQQKMGIGFVFQMFFYVAIVCFQKGKGFTPSVVVLNHVLPFQVRLNNFLRRSQLDLVLSKWGDISTAHDVATFAGCFGAYVFNRLMRKSKI